MRILWLKTDLLHPIDRGGKIRTYHMLRALKQHHHVTYVALDNGRAPDEAAALASEYCHELVRIPYREPERRSAAFWMDLARNLLSPLPYAIGKYHSPAMRSVIEERVSRGDVDLLVCDFLMPAQNVPDQLRCSTVLFQHNVEASIWRRHVEVQASRLGRAYFAEQSRRMERFEREQCRRFDVVVAVSQEDADALRDHYDLPRVRAIPTGVDTTAFAPADAALAEPGRIVFVGAMDWMPNEDGIQWFAGEVLPRIRAQVAGATLTIVGRNPGPAVRRLEDGAGGVSVTGTVPDVRPYLEAASLVVVPLRVGGGTRLKIYEAMSMDRPVVSTTIGAEGLPLAEGRHIVRADDAAAFADACVRLLRSPAEAWAMAHEGGAYVRASFGWDRVAGEFARLCTEADALVGAAAQEAQA
jgi:sugar transferase (PEP-CTERM/EpsH1 system associated)